MAKRLSLAIIVIIYVYVFSLSLVLSAQDSAPTDTLEVNNHIQTLIDNMVYVQGGTFTMGCTSEQGNNCDSDELPAHEVAISDYNISRYEVTQAQWRAIMGEDPSELYNKGCDQCPVEGVTWVHVQEFIQKLNNQTGYVFRLPTEAEWEYAARGGNKSNNYIYSGSNNLNEVAWYAENAKQDNIHGIQKSTRPVGEKQPNELGLYDMSGNVWEWCSDLFKVYPGSSEIDDFIVGFYINRGGSWGSTLLRCRVSLRYYDEPDERGGHLGFRLVYSE